MKTVKMKPIIWLLAGVLFAEIFICNFSAWKSLFYKERIVFGNIAVEGSNIERIEGGNEYIAGDGELTVHISEVDKKLHNLFFALSFSEKEAVPYTVALTDEGNHYAYELPENYIMPGVIPTFYTNIYPAGKVGELTIRFTVPQGSVISIDGICANARIPFVISAGRMLVMFAVVFLLYLAQTDVFIRKEVKGREVRRRELILTAAAVILLIGGAWRLAHVNPVCIASPWPHHKQYQELATAMARGQVALDIEPSEGLLNADNPYDTIYLQANGIDYRADYAYHEGKYYVYFGVAPELLLYLPCYLLTGRQLPNYMAVFLFYSGFILAVFALFKEIIKRWFEGTPFPVYLIVSTLTVCCGNYLFVIARPDLYDTPIMAAAMFTAAGLWLWIRGKYEGGKQKNICFLSGSLCMALVAGCRPQMLLFSALAVPLFWNEVIKKRELFSKESIKETMYISLPYLIVAAGIMYYNYARFGSPFDFGAAYSLTSNDMTKRSFNLHQALLGIWHYFFQPPLLGSDFPFLNGNQIQSAAYMGKLNAEYTYGGILTCNVFTWVLLSVGKWKEELKRRGLYSFLLVSLSVSLLIAIVDVTGAGILQRYMVDMVWGIWLGAAILVLLIVEKARNTRYYRLVITGLMVMVLLQAAYGFGVVFGNGDLSVNVRTSNPELYYRVRTLLTFF